MRDIWKVCGEIQKLPKMDKMITCTEYEKVSEDGQKYWEGREEIAGRPDSGSKWDKNQQGGTDRWDRLKAISERGYRDEKTITSLYFCFFMTFFKQKKSASFYSFGSLKSFLHCFPQSLLIRRIFVSRSVVSVCFVSPNRNTPLRGQSDWIRNGTEPAQMVWNVQFRRYWKRKNSVL